jgi:hypothetical protein
MLQQPIALATPWEAGSGATLAGSRRDLEGSVAVLVAALPFGRVRRLERVDPARNRARCSMLSLRLDHLGTLGLVRTWDRLGRASRRAGLAGHPLGTAGRTHVLSAGVTDALAEVSGDGGERRRQAAGRRRWRSARRKDAW